MSKTANSSHQPQSQIPRNSNYNSKKSFYKAVSVLLNELADLEKSVEMSRNELLSNPNFCATKVFNYLDIRNRGFLVARDIRLFLEKNSVFVTKIESELVFNSFDMDQDGKINWYEFCDTVISANYDYDTLVDRDVLISSKLQESIVNILMNELEGLKMIEKYKHRVLEIECDEYNLDKLFEELDTIQKGFMDVRDVYDFLKAHSSSVAYARAERVLRRLDGDADGKINFDDWIDGLIPESKDPNKYELGESKENIRGASSSQNQAENQEKLMSTLEEAKNEIALKNIRKLKAIGSMSSIAPENLKQEKYPRSNIPELKDIKISSIDNKHGPMGTNKKNLDSLVGGLRKHEVDNQMTQKGKLLQEHTKQGDNVKIEKFANRLAVNGEKALVPENKPIMNKNQVQQYLSSQNQAREEKQKKFTPTETQPAPQILSERNQISRKYSRQPPGTLSDRCTFGNTELKYARVERFNKPSQPTESIQNNPETEKEKDDMESLKKKIQIRANELDLQEKSQTHSSLQQRIVKVNFSKKLQKDELKGPQSSSLQQHPSRKVEIEKIIGSPEIKERLAQNSVDASKIESKPLNIGSFSISNDGVNRFQGRGLQSQYSVPPEEKFIPRYQRDNPIPEKILSKEPQKDPRQITQPPYRRNNLKQEYNASLQQSDSNIAVLRKRTKTVNEVSEAEKKIKDIPQTVQKEKKYAAQKCSDKNIPNQPAYRGQRLQNEIMPIPNRYAPTSKYGTRDSAVIKGRNSSAFERSKNRQKSHQRYFKERNPSLSYNLDASIDENAISHEKLRDTSPLNPQFNRSFAPGLKSGQNALESRINSSLMSDCNQTRNASNPYSKPTQNWRNHRKEEANNRPFTQTVPINRSNSPYLRNNSGSNLKELPAHSNTPQGNNGLGYYRRSFSRKYNHLYNNLVDESKSVDKGSIEEYRLVESPGGNKLAAGSQRSFVTKNIDKVDQESNQKNIYTSHNRLRSCSPGLSNSKQNYSPGFGTTKYSGASNAPIWENNGQTPGQKYQPQHLQKNLSNLKNDGILGDHQDNYSPRGPMLNNKADFATFNADQDANKNQQLNPPANQLSHYNPEMTNIKQPMRNGYNRQHLPWSKRRQMYNNNGPQAPGYGRYRNLSPYNRYGAAIPQFNLSSPLQNRYTPTKSKTNGNTGLTSTHKSQSPAYFGKENRDFPQAYSGINNTKQRQFRPSYSHKPAHAESNLFSDNQMNPQPLAQRTQDLNSSLIPSIYSRGQNNFEISRNGEGVPIRRRPKVQNDDFEFKYIAPRRVPNYNYGFKR